MKTKTALSLTLILLFSSACLSASTVKETREVGSFSKISVSNGIDLLFVQANSEKIEVEADNDIIQKVVTKVKGNTLVVEMEKTKLSLKNRRIKVYVTAPEIDEVNLSSGAEFHCTELKCKSSFGMSISSGAEGEIGRLIAADKVQISTSSGSDCEIKDLKTIKCSLSASSGSDIDVSAIITEEISMSASSGSDISVKGQAQKVKASASSGANINIEKLSYNTIDSSKSSGGKVRK
jgi:Protein of unknown function (DUF2807).